MAILLLLLFFQLVPSATPLSFNFFTFPNGTNSLSLEGDAYIDGEFLRLTKSVSDNVTDPSVGRATYTQPFLLRENATGKLADFATNFTFVIDSQGRTPYDEGLAFFLAPNGSFINSPLSRGPGLGLPMDGPPLKMSTTRCPFVAVEFDIHSNIEPSVQDPTWGHVGVDINNVKSKKIQAWNGSITEGRVNSAGITYRSATNQLKIVFTSYVNGTKVTKHIDCVVDLDKIFQGWLIVGFSAATGAKTALHKINSWSFSSTHVYDENAKINTPVIPQGNGIHNVGLMVGLGVGGFVVMVIGGLISVWYAFQKQRKTGEFSDKDEDSMVNDSIDEEFEKGTGPKKFSFRKLAQSTKNFSEGEKLGEGGFGGVYRGFIKDLNLYVAVKRISSGSRQGLKEYAAEVRIISRLRHRNLVQLIGWCHEKKQLLLVYEFMSNGSLDSHLFNKTNLLPWQARYRVAQGLASGLFYLHEEWEQCVLHRDVKSSNVMLDSNFNAKLGDFGLARLVDHGKQSQTTVLAGTMGYMAPECVNTGKASKETDVYSFGVVALEIACGRKPIFDPEPGRNQINIVEWVWELYGEGKVVEAADPKLCVDFDEMEMESLLIVGLWCAHPDCKMRPSIQQAIQVLKFEIPLPVLSSKMPVPSYFSAPVSFSILFDHNADDLERGETECSGNTNFSQCTTSSASSSSPSLALLYSD